MSAGRLKLQHMKNIRQGNRRLKRGKGRKLLNRKRPKRLQWAEAVNEFSGEICLGWRMLVRNWRPG